MLLKSTDAHFERLSAMTVWDYVYTDTHISETRIRASMGATKKFSKREIDFVVEKFVEGLSYSEVAEKYDIGSRQNAYKITMGAINKMRDLKLRVRKK